MNVFVEDNLAIEIHYTNTELTEMMLYLPDHAKTYFLSVRDYDRQLRIMNCKWINEIETAILKFVNQENQ
jgi:hypothetical protein